MVYPDGEVVRFPAGGPVEADLMALVDAELAKTSLGFWITQPTTQKAALAAVAAALYAFKAQSLNVVR